MTGEPDLGDFARALHDELDARARAETPVADVADVLARAEALAPRYVPSGLRRSLPVYAGEDQAELEDPGLRVFAEALRERHEHALHERRHAPIPAPPVAVRRLRWLVVCAAVLVLGLALVAGLSAVVSERGLDDAPVEAERSARPSSEGGHAVRRESTAEASVREAAVPEELREPEQLPSETPAIETPAIEAPATEAPAAEEGASRARPSERPAPSTTELEAQARAAWGRGELAKAERLFRIIVAREGRSSRADLAYGDLFSLARRQHGAEGQAKVWREYLRRFPQGRFAQDARAGLCRRASGEARVACWQRYLAAHPAGTHASEARAVVDAASKAEP